MRLTHLDILEQCFHEKFRGYHKGEVETFLHLVADDYQEMTEEIDKLKNELAEKDRIIENIENNKEASLAANGNGQTSRASAKNTAKRGDHYLHDKSETHIQKGLE